ncbi:hypothetical protein L226DRAFT_608687 [Lentinus tigrinus ALCF2SS1-7]|uniref:F-box domain-containing protein n=1 Tax=Lentinus tigrinus ALCF2SS1-6 TaxID=1328759 RepID=A0A5C2SUG4_9APHY|nr:hypothetical protein L227DRAFT_648569 [Lentinus tigrinus ALCF2SS1-6]RPD81462.1 hypothetical protein L226DRAFT_608687 [Lentinus tigrinus ALCF2SS1-7]
MPSTSPVRVVNLPDPQPVVHDDGGIPAIPDDIVREISRFLDFSDRLALALTSRHMHAVVQLRLQEIVVEAPQLAALRKWIFEDPSVRGPRLRVLNFVAPPESWSWFEPQLYAPAIQDCFDIMGQATRLEDLSCAPFLSLALDSEHLRAFTGLKCLHLSGCTPEMLAALRLPDTLTQLHLSDSLAGTVLPFRRVLRFIYRLPALTTLVLERLSLPDDEEGDADDDDDVDEGENAFADEFDDNDADEHDGANEDLEEDPGGNGDEDNPMSGNHHNSSAIIISSVRTLRTLEQELPPCISLPITFPNLQTLVLDGSTHMNADVDIGIWGTLQHLMVSSSFNGEPVRWRVNHLTYIPSFAAQDGVILDSACDPAHLVTLTLQLVFVSSLVWDKLLSDAANIRLLEIESLQSTFPTYISLFSELFKPDAPIDLPLICLSILAPAAPNQAPEHIEEKRNVFLNHASLYLPSLRYVALAKSPASETLPCEDDYSEIAAPWRWWRVVRDENACPIEIREIPGWEGERVRRYLCNADREGAEHFDDYFVALR